MTEPPAPELHELLTEQTNTASRTIDCLSAVEIARLMNAEDATVAIAVSSQIEPIGMAIEGIVERMGQGGRLIYIGAGTSGRLGVLDASECPPTFSTDPAQVVGWLAGGTRALTHASEGLEDDAEAGATAIDKLAIGPLDAVVGLTASGRTPFVLGAVDAARVRGAFTIGVACNVPSLLHQRVDVMIAPVTGPEVIAGSTRLKAGTAQKMILNMLSTGAMIKLGKTFGNLMVDVKATNAKLQERAIRIVQEATGLPRADAVTALEAAGGETKTAIVSVLAGIPADEARALIDECRWIGARGAGGPGSMPVAQRAVCAVDGGGTKTLAIVMDQDGNELGRATSGPSNAVAGEADRVVTNITVAVEAAVESSGATLPIEALWVGLAGIDRAGAREAIAARLTHLAAEVRLTNDAQLLFGAFPDEVGIVLIAGTGSIALGQDRHGKTARAGGWGYLVGDEGSGYDLGRRAIRAAAKAADGRGLQTSLLPALLAHWGLEQPLQIIDRVYREQDKTVIAECARLVFDAADAWDPVATRLVQSGAAELATAAGAVEQALDFEGVAPVVLAGSVLVERERYREMVLDRMDHQFDLGPVHIVDEPALMAARHLARNTGA